MIKAVLIDDEESSLRLMRGIVEWERLGYSVAGTATDGQEGLALYRAVRPDLLLVDIRMPIMDGLQLIEAVRGEDAAVKIVILSAYGEFEYAQKAIDLGVDAYLLKPLNEDKLTRLLESMRDEWLRERSGADERGRPARERAPEADWGDFYGGDGNAPGDKREAAAFRRLPDEYMLDHQLVLIERMQVCDLGYVRRFLEDSFRRFRSERTYPPDVFEFCERIAGLALRLVHKVEASDGREAGRPSWMEPRPLSCAELEESVVGLTEDALRRVRSAYESNRNGAIVAKAKAFALQHYLDKSFTIVDAAGHVGLSKSHFSKIFKDCTGENFWDYVIKLKLEKAKYELKHTLKTNYEIAQLIGYESEYHFSRMFHKTVGMSASQYRKTQMSGCETTVG